MMYTLPNDNFKITLGIDEYANYLDHQERRLYLNVEIETSNNEDGGFEFSTVGAIVDSILAYNRQDQGKDISERKPIRLYINSPGGDICEGFALVSAIEVSKTPVYTINTGQWSSMAFLVGITGHRRFSLPYMTFLMHDGSTLTFGSANKAQDKMKFDERFEREVVKTHVLRHSKIKGIDYDALVRVEYYMLPEDALEHGFIDEIVTDIDNIL